MTTPRIATFALPLLLIGTLGLSPAWAQEIENLSPRQDLWIEAAPSATLTRGDTSPYVGLVDDVGPAVVSVTVSYDNGGRPLSRTVPSQQQLAEGSGFIIHPDGYILTNFHVIDRAEEVTVKLPDNRQFSARVIGVDPDTDVALMKIDAGEPLPAVHLGRSADLRAGEYVVAIGNPMGLSHSVTAGIVSFVGRRDLPIEGRAQQAQFIQTDAPINPGNSGGPLINMEGEVIGMNTAIYRHGQGISFAIPIDTVKTLLPQLEERGYVPRSWMGIRIQDLDPLLAQSFGLADHRGALVTEVLDNSPASRAGIQEQDVILALDGRALEDGTLLPWLVATTPESTRLTLSVHRNGEEIELPVDIESIPNQRPPSLPGRQADVESSAPALGIEVSSMTERLARQVGAADLDYGVVVTALSDSSAARAAGLRNRDVILEVGAEKVSSEEEFHSLLEAFDAGDVVRLKVQRRGRSVYLAFTR